MAIEVLDDIVANQIAAGEVVNRPASVVKELLENAMDAGATRVQLVIRDAGKTLIQVSDNGCGMDKEDAQKCFLPHATSKIKSSEDLLNLHTMGFRGEALASIAAIAQVELKTRREEDETGVKVVIEGGVVKEVCETACSIGTCVSVKNIFFNTPARRNFLKTEQIENSHINEEFVRVAMINTETAFSYINNEKNVYSLTVGNAKKRIIELFGNSISDKLIPVSEKVDLVDIEGYVCSPEFAKKNKSWQYFFVNGRFMRNTYFANAVDRAFANLLPEKNYPAFFIRLSLPPQNIDVNIHPTKTEVKFLDERVIYSILHASVKKSIGQYSLASELDFSVKTIEFPVITSQTPIPKAPQIRFNPEFNPFDTSSEENFSLLQEKPVVQPSLFESDMPQQATKPVPQPMENRKDEKAFMQIGEKYIAVRSKNSMLLIDQSRASQRIIHDRVLASQSLQIFSQRLLTPQRHLFSPHISFRLVEFLPVLKLYGIEMEYDKKDGSFLLMAKPEKQSSEECFELAEELITSNNEQIPGEEQLRKRAFMLSEKLKIQYGESLSQNRMQTLVSQLFCLPDCMLDPKGEKIIFKLTIEDMDKFFE